ncbi:MAG TPA: pitrilysin family protein [Steroidobacteraceae bacterium]
MSARTRAHGGACAFAAALACAGAAPALLWAQTAPSAADSGHVVDSSQVLRATLPNGLRVVIVRNALAPVVATSVNYLVGSDEAPPGFPGTAHAQEHMMFRGSPGLTADQLADIGSVMGGNFNANTRESLTQYLFTVPAEDLDIALHIEAIRMGGVLDTRQDWNQERGAIEQEVAQDLSNPGYVLYEKLRAAMFAGTPYAHDALGTRPSFDATSAQMLRRFHDAWYAPNNAILIVVGDLDPAATLEKIRTLFGPIPSKPVPAAPPVKPRPMRAASFKVDTDRPTGTLMIALRVPGLHSADFPALEVLSDILSSQRFDLYGLVPAGKALNAEFALDPLPQAGLAYAEVEFPKGQDPAALEAQVRSILKRVAQHGVPPELLQAAKLQERRETEFQKNSIEGLASIWADAVALYGLQSPEEDLQRIEKVTVEDVDRVARKYLDLTHAVAAVMVPQGAGRPVASGGGFGGQENISLGEARPTALPEWAQASLQRLEVKPSSIDPVLSTLANGLTLIVQSEDVSDTVSVFGHIRNRPETESDAQQQGVAQLLDPLLGYGSEQLDRLAFQRALDDIGAGEEAGTDFDVQVLSEDFDRGVALLADNELHPALPAAAMSVVSRQLVQIVAARNRSPGYLTQRSLRSALFPPDDPSQREATPEGVRALTLEDVRAYYHEVFRPDLTTIVVVGRVSPAQARATIEKYFGGWSASGAPPDTDLPAAPANKPSTVAVPDASRVQDNVILAQNLALTRSDPDYYPLELGSAVLGGGFYSTRLSIDLRKNSGLVYSVGSTLQAGRTRGVYFIRYACDPQNVDKAESMAVQELRNMQQAPVGADELLRVKELLLRQIPLAEASVEGIAHGLIERRELGLPLDEPWIAAHRYIDLTPAQVQAAFQKWMRPNDLVRITQGPPPQ